MDNYEFGNRLCELRKAHGYTQQKLGKMLGVSNKAVSKWENGESMPRLQMIDKIAECFDLSVDELMGYTGISQQHLKDDPVEEMTEENISPIKKILNSKGFKLLAVLVGVGVLWIWYFSKTHGYIGAVEKIFSTPFILGIPIAVVTLILLLSLVFLIINEEKKFIGTVIVAAFFAVALPIIMFSVESRMVVDKLYIRNALFDKYDLHAMPSLPELDYSQDAAGYDMFVVGDEYGFAGTGLSSVKSKSNDETGFNFYNSIDFSAYEFKVSKWRREKVRKELTQEYDIFLPKADSTVKTSGECIGWKYDCTVSCLHFDNYYYDETPRERDLAVYCIYMEKDDRIAVIRINADNCEPFDVDAIAQYLCSFEYDYENLTEQ